MHARLFDSIPFGVQLRGVIERAYALFADGSDSSLVRRLAGAAFLIRVVSAALTFVSQILLARWMGGFEFGIYIYGWTWVLLIGGMVDLGLGSAAQRFIPEYTEQKRFTLLRGFLSGSRWLALLFGTIAGAVGALTVKLLTPHIDPSTVVPLYLSCASLPLFGVWSAQSGIARSYNWVNLGLSPVYVQRPILLLALMGLIVMLGFPTDAVTATLVGVVALTSVGLAQVVVLNRRLAGVVEDGPRSYAARTWLAVSAPIFLVEAFYYLLTYSDIIVLKAVSLGRRRRDLLRGVEDDRARLVHLLFGGADDRSQIRRIRCQRQPRRPCRLSQAIGAADVLALGRGDYRPARAWASAAAAVRP